MAIPPLPGEGGRPYGARVHPRVPAPDGYRDPAVGHRDVAGGRSPGRVEHPDFFLGPPASYPGARPAIRSTPRRPPGRPARSRRSAPPPAPGARRPPPTPPPASRRAPPPAGYQLDRRPRPPARAPPADSRGRPPVRAPGLLGGARGDGPGQAPGWAQAGPSRPPPAGGRPAAAGGLVEALDPIGAIVFLAERCSLSFHNYRSPPEGGASTARQRPNPPGSGPPPNVPTKISGIWDALLQPFLAAGPIRPNKIARPPPEGRFGRVRFRGGLPTASHVCSKGVGWDGRDDEDRKA